MKRSVISVSMALALGMGTFMALLGMLGGRVPSVARAHGLDGYATYYVAPGGNCGSGVSPCYETIQEAVDAVDAADDVVKVSTGTYTGVNDRGGLSQVVYISKTVTIRGGYSTSDWATANPLAQPCTLNAEEQGRVIYITGDITPTIEGLRITGGDAVRGGGVYVVTATAVISGNYILNNSAYYGGGLYLAHSASVIVSNTVSNNSVSASWDSGGGGMYLDYSNAVLRENSITTNTAKHNGGGLYLHYSDAIVEGNLFSGNAVGVYYGGGLYLSHSAATVVSNTITGNTGSWGGGGAALSQSPATLEGNIISANSAGDGGGLWLYGSAARVSGNTITNNTGTSWSGGVRLFESDGAVLIGNTITYNRANNGGGGGVVVNASDATLIGNVVSSNTATYMGGGVYLLGSAATLNSNSVQFNSTQGYGGGISLTGSDAILADNLVKGNTAYGFPSGGGGLYVDSNNAVVTGNTVISNTAGQSGGGVYLGGGSTLNRNAISNNNADWQGGGVYIIGEGSPTLNGNLVISNTAATGGGLYMTNFADAILSNNIVADNRANSSGSGIYVDNSSPVLLHTTIARNTGGDGTGVYVTKYAGTGWHITASFTNTIVVSHTTAVYVASGCTAKLEATLWGTATWANMSDWGGTGTILTGTLNYWEAPGFLDPVAGDYHIRLGSSALEAGVDTWVTDDVDGQTRPHYRAADLGADEWWPLVAVKSAVPDTAEAGEVVTYTLALRNVTTAAMSVSLTDALPSQVTHLGGPVFTGGSGGYAQGIITWTGTVYTNTPVLMTWTVQLSQNVPYSTTVTNIAVVSDAYGVFQTDPTTVLVPPYRVHLPLIMRQLDE